MAINRASLSDTYVAPRPVAPSASRTTRHDGDATRRTAMVLGGVVVALISLAIGSMALVQVWLAPTATGAVNDAPALQSWEALAMIIGGGVGFAAGSALVGIGMGRWTAPRTATDEAAYTGPGGGDDMPDTPRVV